MRPAPDALRKLLRYDPESGKLFWRKRDVSLFEVSDKMTLDHKCSVWNSRYAGMESFKVINSHGYLRGIIFNHQYLAHRVIFALQAGVWTDNMMDHINGIKTDNRWINLRSVTNQENCRNASIRSDNSSGVVGLSWYDKSQKWRVNIRISGVQKHLGYFADKDDAINARAAADIKYGFHKNHGRPAQ